MRVFAIIVQLLISTAQTSIASAHSSAESANQPSDSLRFNYSNVSQGLNSEAPANPTAKQGWNKVKLATFATLSAILFLVCSRNPEATCFVSELFESEPLKMVKETSDKLISVAMSSAESNILTPVSEGVKQYIINPSFEFIDKRAVEPLIAYLLTKIADGSRKFAYNSTVGNGKDAALGAAEYLTSLVSNGGEYIGNIVSAVSERSNAKINTPATAEQAHGQTIPVQEIRNKLFSIDFALLALILARRRA